MDTLYELLGALPRDDAEALRVAFRKAVKGAHPDLRPDDPDAAIRFRQIVRANDILLDKDQRAVYDHLLVLAKHEKDPASAHPIAARVHKIASTVLALTSLSLVTAGGYFLFMHMSMAWVAPARVAVASYAPLYAPPSNADLKTRVSASIAAVSPSDAPDPAAVNAFIAARGEGTGAHLQKATNAMAMAPADAEGASPPSNAAQDSDAANVAHPRDIAALIASEVSGSILDPDHVAHLDQNFTAPYVDRGLLFIRDKKDDHPLAELPSLKPADRPGHPKSLAAAAAGKPQHPETSPKTEALPKTVPLPVPRSAPPHVAQPRREPWPGREPWYTAGGS